MSYAKITNVKISSKVKISNNLKQQHHKKKKRRIFVLPTAMVPAVYNQWHGKPDRRLKKNPAVYSNVSGRTLITEVTPRDYATVPLVPYVNTARFLNVFFATR